jgi:hypothetical protein
MVVDPDESDEEVYDAWYDQADEEADPDYESDFDKEEPEREVPTIPSSWEDADVGMVKLGRKTPSRRGQSLSPTPVQLASKSSPWKTLGAQRVSLRAVQDKIDAERKVKEQMEREQELKRQRDKELALERQWKEEQQELKAEAERKARMEREEAEAKAKAKEAAVRAKTKKLEVEAELKRRQDEEAAVKEARAERRKARSYEREHELRMNRNQITAKPTVVQTTETDSEVDQEDHAEMLALLQEKAQPVSSKSERVEEEKKEEEVKKVKKEKEVWTVVKGGKTTKEPVVLKMGQAPYRKPGVGMVGPVGVVGVSNEDRLAKTRMCISVEKGVKCPHGDNCRFAHSLSELKLAPCMYGCDCRFVQSKGDGVFGNKPPGAEPMRGQKVCKFIHTDETKESYYERTGLKPISAMSSAKGVVNTALKKKLPPPPPRGWSEPPKIPRSEFVCSPCDETLSTISFASSSTFSSTAGSRRVCKYVAEGKVCPHQKCRFSHEVAKSEVCKPVASKPEPKPRGAEPKPRGVGESVLPLDMPAPAPSVQTIYVPESQYMLALEMAMKSGKSIRIEVAK